MTDNLSLELTGKDLDTPVQDPLELNIEDLQTICTDLPEGGWEYESRIRIPTTIGGGVALTLFDKVRVPPVHGWSHEDLDSKIRSISWDRISRLWQTCLATRQLPTMPAETIDINLDDLIADEPVIA